MMGLQEYLSATIHRPPCMEEGYFFLYKFPNGYQACVTREDYRYDGFHWRFRIEIQDGKGDSYDYPKFGGLISTPKFWLDENEVKETLEKIKAL